jgi:DNA transformation protein
MSDDDYVAWVLEQLDGLGLVNARAMFGGHGLYRRGDFFGIVYDDRLYFRTDEESRKQYVEAGSGPFTPNAKQTARSYFEVPAEVIEDREQLGKWAQRALDTVPPSGKSKRA